MGHLELREARKVFDGGGSQIVAVDDLDLEVRDGEFLVLVGPSGCGKSTTLRCIAGLEQVSSGQVLLDGDDITDNKPKERDMAMVFQNYALYPHMTVKQNIGYGLKITSDLSKSEVFDRVEETAELLEISDLLEKKPKALSGGQQQRVALGRAIIRDPKVFLMDEPLSNLDAKLRTTMRTELQQLQTDLGTTTIYVTHDQTEAMTMGDRIAVLDGGELQQVGTPLECYHEPNNQFVAGFIGSPSMNFLTVDRRGSELHHDAFTYELSDRTAATVGPEHDRLRMGIRPEHIEVNRESASDSVRTTVDVIEPMGEVTYAYFELGGKTYTASVDGERRIQASDTVHVGFPERKIHLFDAESGDSLKSSEISEPADVPAGG
jgi:multiple sugar transport system ATP-binding protein